jgi:seryl-tRNA synthetase
MINLDRLTNKKKEYLQDAIIDKNGAYSYLEDPLEYKKARKRLQNRESAVRSRQRKKNYQEVLEKQIDEQNALIERLQKDRSQLQESNAALTSENACLK